MAANPGLRTGPMSRAATVKARGAFYTDAHVADFLVWWAMRSAADTVVDPCFGGGVFIRSACNRLTRLGGLPARQVFGVEIDPTVHARISDQLTCEYGLPPENLMLGDFFDVDPATTHHADAIVGNPPFIRYHRFVGDDRRRALARAAAQGVRLSELSSSWAPFLVHSIAMLKPGGRLAMVIPMEIGYAAYALPILQHLRHSFGAVTFLTFRHRLFPELSEDTLLLLAEDKGSSTSAFSQLDIDDAGSLVDIVSRDRLPLADVAPVDAQAIACGHQRLVEHLIPKHARELYRELKSLSPIRRLGELADVGIGYVTGANDFFHLDPRKARFWGIPDAYLQPAVCRSRALSGLRFGEQDWRAGLASGDCAYLLRVEAGADLPEGVLAYLRHGELRGVPQAYKCRTRSPWFRVPHVYRSDAFLSYMSGHRPRLVADDAGAVAPNTLHVVRLRPGNSLTGDALAALWQTSLTSLSVELEGHPLGGGMLKLEPTEAEGVAVAVPESADSALVELSAELDARLRNGRFSEAEAIADRLILRSSLGLSERDCSLLRLAADSLRTRRYSRS